MRLKTPVFLFLIVLTVFTFNVNAQQNLALGRERFAQPNLKNYTDPELKIQYNLEKTALELINSQRAQEGLTPLNWNEKAAQVARLHSENMAHYKFFNHRGLDGLMVNERADNLGIDWRAIGENIAYNRGYEDPVGFTVKRWMESPSHKENIMDRRWKETGIGVITSPDGTYYLTQVFLVS
jgi:uncharacterized protein YkwD